MATVIAAKPGAGPIDRFAVSTMSEQNAANMLWFPIGLDVLAGIVLIIVGFAMGGDSFAHEGNKIHWGLVHLGLGFLVGAIILTFVLMLLSSRNSIRSMRYSPSLSYQACDLYWRFSEENRQVARPTVEWILRNHDARNSRGETLYSRECKQRFNALDALLAEQVATENTLRLVNTDDLLNIQEYTKALSEARKTYSALIG